MSVEVRRAGVTDESDVSEQESASRSSGPYAHFVLAVLVLVYVFNFVDRNILSILAEDIKADLGISDSEIGFRRRIQGADSWVGFMDWIGMDWF